MNHKRAIRTYFQVVNRTVIQ